MKPLLRLAPALLALAPATALAGQGIDLARAVNAVIIALILGTIVMIISIPWLYKRGLKNQGEKNLKGFLINDPATRDLLLKKKQGQTAAGKPVATPAAGAPPKPGTPDTVATPAPEIKTTGRMPVPPAPTRPVPPPETNDPDDAFVDVGAPPPKPKK